jgi:DNA-binding LytR/AlgR family response regulator
VKIAIIDDDMQASEELQRALQECEFDLVAQAEMQLFASGEHFLDAFKPEEFQLVFLDICMDGINGIETALAIRQQDERLPIIFLTSSVDYALDGYRAFPEGYLLKPVCKALPQLMEILQRCLPKLTVCMFTVRINGRELQLSADRIAYIDVQGGHRVGGRRGSVLHLMTGESVAVDTSYAEVAEMLKPTKFIECYNRLLVNLAAVDTLLNDRFALKNGEQVPISRRLYRETAHEYMEYLLGK